MSHAQFERTMRFRASHHYARDDRSEEENREIFGALVDPHPHDWTVTVFTVGPMEDRTGFSVDLPALDAALEELIAPLRDADLNEVVRPVREGRILPSCEALARWMHRELADRIPSPARLVRVRVAESEGIAASWPPEGA